MRILEHFKTVYVKYYIKYYNVVIAIMCHVDINYHHRCRVLKMRKTTLTTDAYYNG